MGLAIVQLVNIIIGALSWIIILNALVSWLVAFDVINPRNRLVYSILRFLDAVTRPILAPFQRIIPPLGGVDISPIIVLLILQGVKAYLLPLAFGPLVALMG